MKLIIKESARELFREAGERFARAVLESTGPVFSAALDEKKKLVTAVRGGDPNVYRLSLTLPVLNQARMVLFVVSGAKKAETLGSIFSSAGTGDLPAAMVNPFHGRVTWIVDRDAASLLPVQP
jgi:6-phosphogluconolactonase/glucosamine-6-phosphate isomerase/deaminase